MVTLLFILYMMNWLSAQDEAEAVEEMKKQKEKKGMKKKKKKEVEAAEKVKYMQNERVKQTPSQIHV